MNVRKAIDYSELFEAIDKAVRAALPQMELYREIGRLICERPEKGTAVAVAEHLQSAFSDIGGFSPRNVRRMRDFCLTYKSSPELIDEAMQIGWTQNLVIMESALSLDERGWYIRAARRYGWSKQELTQRIAENAHMDHTLSLDTPLDPCYADPDETEACPRHFFVATAPAENWAIPSISRPAASLPNTASTTPAKQRGCSYAGTISVTIC